MKEMDKFEQVVADENFVKQLTKLQNEEDVMAAYAKKGVDINAIKPQETDLNSALAEGEVELAAEDLDNVAGGVVITAAGAIAVLKGIGIVIGGALAAKVYWETVVRWKRPDLYKAFKIR